VRVQSGPVEAFLLEAFLAVHVAFVAVRVTSSDLLSAFLARETLLVVWFAFKLNGLGRVHSRFADGALGSTSAELRELGVIRLGVLGSSCHLSLFGAEATTAEAESAVEGTFVLVAVTHSHLAPAATVTGASQAVSVEHLLLVRDSLGGIHALGASSTRGSASTKLGGNGARGTGGLLRGPNLCLLFSVTATTKAQTAEQFAFVARAIGGGKLALALVASQAFNVVDLFFVGRGLGRVHTLGATSARGTTTTKLRRSGRGRCSSGLPGPLGLLLAETSTVEAHCAVDLIFKLSGASRSKLLSASATAFEAFGMVGFLLERYRLCGVHTLGAHDTRGATSTELGSQGRVGAAASLGYPLHVALFLGIASFAEARFAVNLSLVLGCCGSGDLLVAGQAAKALNMVGKFLKLNRLGRVNRFCAHSAFLSTSAPFARHSQ